MVDAGSTERIESVASGIPDAAHDTQRDALVARLFGATLGMMELVSVYLGERLGFYRGLMEAGAATSGELAARVGADERYTREWLEQQAVNGLLTVGGTANEPPARRYRLPAGHAEVLLDRDSLAYMTPLAKQLVGMLLPLPALVEAFRSGAGVPYADYGTDTREGIAEANRALFVNLLGREWLPAIPELHARLLAAPPARVADVGCGTGWSSIAIARAYPAALIDGFDLDAASVATATANAATEGLAARVAFAVRDAADPQLAGQYDLALAIECIHDMSQPVAALRAMRGLIRPGGVVLIVDERVAERFAVPGDEIERLMYGFSILHCLPVGRVGDHAAGTGTVMRAETLRGYAREAGFSAMAILPIAHDLWRFYELVA